MTFFEFSSSLLLKYGHKCFVCSQRMRAFYFKYRIGESPLLQDRIVIIVFTSMFGFDSHIDVICKNWL